MRVSFKVIPPSPPSQKTPFFFKVQMFSIFPDAVEKVSENMGNICIFLKKCVFIRIYFLTAH